MNLILATVRDSTKKDSLLGQLLREYVERCSHFFPTEWKALRSVEDLLALGARPATCLILLDPGGKELSSEMFASLLGKLRDGGKRTIVLAIGPANGWNAQDRHAAEHLLSMGPMTLPHQLAAVVLAEQMYRAATILVGHPYHLGH